MEDVCLKVWLIAQNLGKNITDFEPSAIISIEGQLSPPSMVQSYWTSQNEAADTQKYHFCNFCTLILIHLNVVFIPKLQELCPKSLAPHGGAARKRRGGSCTAQRRGEAGDDGGWSWKKGWDTPPRERSHIPPKMGILSRWFSQLPKVGDVSKSIQKPWGDAAGSRDCLTATAGGCFQCCLVWKILCRFCQRLCR